eukprot:c10774_g1_i1.p1 GENE.c10774_g1_i1~~c10774_g1_i1.p1  ORF type:complete len:166 (+),score=55.91 c10774_g1_i1:24-500(+)
METELSHVAKKRSVESRTKPRSIVHRIPIIGGCISSVNSIRRKRVYPPNFKQQDEAFQRLTRVTIPFKTALLSFFLVIFGIIFLPLGIFFIAVASKTSEKYVGIAFVVLATLAIIPGTYQLFLIFLAYMEIPGFTFEGLATFDDEWDISEAEDEKPVL